MLFSTQQKITTQRLLIELQPVLATMSAQEMPPTSITLPPNTHFESAVDLDEVQTKDPTHVLQSSTPVELSHLTSHPQPRRDSFTTASSNLPASATPRLQDEESFATNPIPPVVAGQQEPAASGMASTIKPAAARDDTAQSGAVTTSNSDAVSTPAEASRATPVVLITLLLTTGVRQTYDIDAKYLQDHKVAGSNAETDPFTISAYTLKELIWKAWQEGIFIPHSIAFVLIG